MITWIKRHPLRISTGFFCTVIYAGFLMFGVDKIGLPFSVIATGLLGLIFTGLIAFDA